MKGREMPKEMSWCGNQSIGAKMWHVGEMWPLEREMRDRGGKMRKNEGEILVTCSRPACSLECFTCDTLQKIPTQHVTARYLSTRV